MKRVLVTALDWGLGHATRVVPVVRELLNRSLEVHIGSSGDALTLLRLEFPDLPFVALPPYAPTYGYPLGASLLWQLPRFARTIRAEHAGVASYVRTHGIEAVLSDNRYGCHHASVRSVIITHQPTVQMPPGIGWLRKPANRKLKNWLETFDEVWIPDDPDVRLTSAFVDPWKGEKRFIGWLSRFSRQPESDSRNVVAVVSGPEPQRSLFADALASQLRASGLKAMMITGQPGVKVHRQQGNLEIRNHLPAEELQTVLASADVVVARSGYSTIMDLIALQKKAIFIPTPQQQEQLVLARDLMQRGIAQFQDQRSLDIAGAYAKRLHFRGFGGWPSQGELLRRALDDLLT